jgi:hypothetical protein
MTVAVPSSSCSTTNAVEPSPSHYWSFVSYSHSDEKQAVWLHRALERYRFPKRLRGKRTPVGTIPTRLYPVFRDRDEFAGDASLSHATNVALQQSATLVVVCSPSAARSRWVNEEVRAFKSLGRGDRVFCCIVAGDPAPRGTEVEASENCFPPAVLATYDAEGISTPNTVTPLACDLRRGKDGKWQSRLKLLAAITGIPYDELRARETRRWRLRTAFGGLAATIACAALLLGSGLWFLNFRSSRLLQDIALSAGSEQAEALWRLSDSSSWVRAWMLVNATSDRGVASTVTSNPAIIDAAVGLNPKDRRDMLDDWGVLDECYTENQRVEIAGGCHNVMARLGPDSLAALSYLIESKGALNYGITSLAAAILPRLTADDGWAAVDLILNKLRSAAGTAEDRQSSFERAAVATYSMLLPVSVASLSDERALAIAGPVKRLRGIDRVPQREFGVALALASAGQAVRPDEAKALLSPLVQLLAGPQFATYSGDLERRAVEKLASQLSSIDRANEFKSLIASLQNKARQNLSSVVADWHFRWFANLVQSLSDKYPDVLSDGEWQHHLAVVHDLKSGRGSFALETAAHLLAPVPPKLASREALDILGGLIALLPAGCRDDKDIAVREIREAFTVLGGRLAAEDAKTGARKVFDLINSENDWPCGDALQAFGGSLDPSDVARKYQRFVQIYRDSDYLSAHTVTIGLASKLDSVDAKNALRELLEPLPTSARTVSKINNEKLAELVAVLGGRLSGEQQRDGAEAQLISRMAEAPFVPCRAFATFVRADNLRTVISILRWPTCEEEDKMRLIERIGQVTGMLFGMRDGPPDKWRFVEWAGERGFMSQSQPTRMNVAHSGKMD